MITDDELYCLTMAPKHLGVPFTNPAFQKKYLACLCVAIDGMRDREKEEAKVEASRIQLRLCDHEHFPESMKDWVRS